MEMASPLSGFYGCYWSWTGEPGNWAPPTARYGAMTPESDQFNNYLRLEREYRRAVVGHQTAVECALEWQADTLPVG